MPHCATMVHSLLVAQRRRVSVRLFAAPDLGDDWIRHLAEMVEGHGGSLTVERLAEALPEPEARRALLAARLEHLPLIGNDYLATAPLDRRRPETAPAGVKPWEPQADPAARDLYWHHREQTAWRAENSLTHPMHEFFVGLRMTRGQRRAASTRNGPANPRRAVITIVHDEAVFLPIWLRYYSRHFAADDIYVLDHETSDGSTDREGFVRIPVERENVDHTWMMQTIQSLQHDLLERGYDAVLVTDVDEIVAPDPRHGSLGDYLDRFEEDFVNCLGYEVLHLPGEAELDLARPLFEQRHWWFANDGYSKPALARVPMEWEPGFHSRADAEMNLDPDLRLIHLHRMDYSVCLARHLKRQRLEWAERDLAAGWADHNRIAEAEAFRSWFYEDSCFEEAGIHIDLEPIPAAWRGVL